MSDDTFRAYGTRVLVDVTKLKQSKGGIYLPEDSAIDPIARGTIVSCGPGCMTPNGVWDAPMVKIGDEILFEKHRSFRLREAGECIFTLWMSDVIAVLRDGEFEQPERNNILLEAGTNYGHANG